MRRILAIVITASAVLVAVPAVSQTPAPDESGHMRIERSIVLDERWRSTEAQAAQIFRESTHLPRAAAEYDVVVSATLELRTSSTDHAAVSATYHVESGAPHPPGAFPPQAFRFMSSKPGRPSTTTAVWSGTLAQTQDPVTFGLQVQAADGPDRGRRARASGNKLTIVIDIWPTD